VHDPTVLDVDEHRRGEQMRQKVGGVALQARGIAPWSQYVISRSDDAPRPEVVAGVVRRQNTTHETVGNPDARRLFLAVQVQCDARPETRLRNAS
jgi:hypothetical protein